MAWLVATPVLAGWDLETVHAYEWGTPPVLALDAAEQPILAFGQGRLIVATQDVSSEWVTELVIDQCGSITGIDSHPVGGLAVSYDNQVTDTLQLAWRQSDSWVIHDLGSNDRLGRSGVVFDTTGRPHVLHYRFDTEAAHVARWTGSDWLHEELGLSSHELYAMTETPDGEPAFTRGELGQEGVHVHRWSATGWTSELIEFGPIPVNATGLSVGHDAAGDVAFALNWNTFQGLYYVRRGPSGWYRERVDRLGGGELFVTHDDAGQPLIVDDAAFLRVHVLIEGTWHVETLDELGDVGARPVHRTSSGEVVLTYAHDAQQDFDTVQLARLTAGTWTTETIGDVGAPAGFGLQLMVDDDGREFLAWDADSEFVLAHRGDDGWIEERIATDAGFLLERDAAGRPIVSYRTDTEAQLVRRVDDRWDREVLPEGIRPSGLAVSSSGQVGLTWVDGGVVMRALKVGNDWVEDSVATLASQVHPRTSSTFDALGRHVIAYRDSPSLPGLMVARDQGAGWLFEELPETEAVDGLDIELGPDGRLHLAYRTSSAVHWAVETREGWQVEEIPGLDSLDGASFWAWPLNMSFASTGQPVVVAHGDGRHGPAVARRTPRGEWWMETVDSRLPQAAWVDVELGAEDELVVAYWASCRQEVVLTRPTAVTGVTLRRWALDDRAELPSLLPLNDDNDEEAPPFPAHLAVPAVLADPLTDGRLVLYLAFDEGGSPAIPPQLRVAKEDGEIVLRYE
ncbi:MAG: hypothetical protein AAF533_11845 [Acidobacteriota bacterium]